MKVYAKCLAATSSTEAPRAHDPLAIVEIKILEPADRADASRILLAQLACCNVDHHVLLAGPDSAKMGNPELC